MGRNITKATLTILFICLSLLPSTISASTDGGWNYVIAPYVLIPSIDGDSSIGRLEGINLEVGPDDIINHLDLGGMLQLEAHHRSGFGLIVAYNFMDLSADAEVPGTPVKLESDIYQGIFEGYGVYRKDMENGTLNFLAGIRWWDIDIELQSNGTALVENKPDWVDPVIGARWTPAISDKWKFILRGDIGGFGVGSDFTWNLQGGFAWEPTDSLSLVFQYRALSVDYTTRTA